MERRRPHFFVLVVVVTLSLTGALSAFHDALTDWRFRLAPRKATGEVVVVAIDARSIERLGVWPWPRSLHADLLTKLRIAGAAGVAFDVDFSSRSSGADDQAFAQALEEFGGSAILPIFKQIGIDNRGASRLYVSRPLPEFSANSWLATVNVTPERSGVVRRYSAGEVIEGDFLPSIGALLAGWYDKKPQSFVLDHSIDAKRIPTVSLVDVLDGTVDLRRLQDKKIIVGATAIELGDRFTTPVAGIISGVQLQALAAEAILQGRMLVTTGIIVSIAGLLALGLFVILVSSRLGAARQAFSLLALAIAVEASGSLLQARAPVMLDTTYWLAGVGGYLVALGLNEFDLRQVLARIAQNRFQSIAISLGDGVLCLDAAGRLTFWNPGAQALFGYTADEMIGRDFGMLHEQPADPGTGDLPSMRTSPDPIEVVGIRKDGQRFPLEVRFSSWDESDGRHFSAILRDISSRKSSEERMRYLALHDSLTGLANRAQFHERLRASIRRASVSRESLAVLLVDLDNFKEINDTLGHESGDRFLCTFAGLLQACAGENTLVARLGGDEFVILAEGDEVEAKLEEIAQAIAAICGNRYTVVDGAGFLISACIGSAVYPSDGAAADEILVNADLALYRAKSRRRGAHVAYHSSFKQELECRRALEDELRRAVERGELELFYQPQVRLRDGAIVGVEALIRWRHPVRGLLTPGDFLEVLNSGNLSIPVGMWVLRTACAQGMQWRAAGHDLRIAVNLSPSQLCSELPRTIEDVLEETGFAPGSLEIEVTENILLDNDTKTIELFKQIRGLGVRIAFDDFGTGYASLSYLRRFPLDRLKIDRSFVGDLGRDLPNTAIVTAVVELAKSLGLSTIAEGIEDQRCVELLKKLGCDEGQGFHFAKPMSVGQIEELLQAHNHLMKYRRASAA